MIMYSVRHGVKAIQSLNFKLNVVEPKGDKVT